MNRPHASLADWIRWSTPERVSLPSVGHSVGFIGEPDGIGGASSADAAMIPIAGQLRLDSRQVLPGDVFAAINGTRTDGHAFIADAIRAGAAAVLCDPSYAPEKPIACHHLHVAGLATRLGAIAQASEGHPARRLKLIGVTGTNGKTTVSTLLWQLLLQMGLKASLLGTAGGRINDTPLNAGHGKGLTTADAVQLAQWMREMVEAGSTHLVMEVSSHALDQHRVGGLAFDVAMFTNLSHDHLDYHGTMEAYASAKKVLFDGLKDEAVSIVNLSDACGGFMVSDTASKVLGVRYRAVNDMDAASGSGMAPDDLLLDYRFVASGGMDLSLEGARMAFPPLRTPLTGRFNAMNAAQAFVAAVALGLDPTGVAEALSRVHGAEGRLQRVGRKCPGEPTVFVDYAHTPDALSNVLETAVEIRNSIQPDGSVILVFGAGGDRDRAKRPVMASVAERLADRIIVTSDNPRSESPEAILDDICRGFSAVSPGRWERIADRREAIRRAISISGGSDIVLLAGKGHETTQEVGDVLHPFDDRQEALAALEERFPC